jgi:hypothetical protein
MTAVCHGQLDFTDKEVKWPKYHATVANQGVQVTLFKFHCESEMRGLASRSGLLITIG